MGGQLVWESSLALPLPWISHPALYHMKRVVDPGAEESSTDRSIALSRSIRLTLLRTNCLQPTRNAVLEKPWLTALQKALQLRPSLSRV